MRNKPLSLNIDFQFKLILDIEGAPQVFFLTVCSGHASRITLFLYAGMALKSCIVEMHEMHAPYYLLLHSFFFWSVAEQIVPIRYVLNCSKGTLNTL